MKIASKLIVCGTAAACLGSVAASSSDWHRDITVCTGGMVAREVIPAKARTEGIFRPIGVTIRWQNLKRCPPGGIQIRFAGDTKPNFFPGALAYARPYEGTHIVVFLDRIRKSIESSLAPALLAHVMAHEITHILQGLSRHSETGIMKARWETAEHSIMGWRTLPFTADDVELIRHAFDRKEVLLATSGLAVRQERERGR